MCPKGSSVSTVEVVQVEQQSSFPSLSVLLIMRPIARSVEDRQRTVLELRLSKLSHKGFYTTCQLVHKELYGLR